jgi:hypothetical protein
MIRRLSEGGLSQSDFYADPVLKVCGMAAFTYAHFMAGGSRYLRLRDINSEAPLHSGKPILTPNPDNNY